MKTLMLSLAAVSMILGISTYNGGLMATPKAFADQQIVLPAPQTQGSMSVEEAMANRRSTRNFSADSLTLQEVSQILWAAQGITETRRNLRTAPSAGATYPLEVFLVSGNIDGLEPGLYRYVPLEHSLHRKGSEDLRDRLYSQALNQSPVRHAPAVIIIAGIFKRTTNRYGSRGEQYVYMEVGHAGQNVHLQAEAIGLGTVVVGAFNDKGVQQVLGLPGDVVPFYLMPVGR